MPSALFQPIALRGLTLPNRIAVSPMCQYSAEAGRATDWHLMHCGQFAVSGVGLLIVEETAVAMQGRIGPGSLCLETDAQEAAIRRVVDFCRAAGNAPLAIQLGHGGRKVATRLPWDGRGRGAVPAEEGGWTGVAPSAVAFGDMPVPAALDRAGMVAIRDAFVAAARRAERIGFDLIELHSGHGYLLSSFLSPLANIRTDDYGGSRENRMRFPLEVFAALRDVWPAEKPLGLRLSATDWEEGGLTPEDAVAYAQALKAMGCDYVTASSGGNSARVGTSFASTIIPLRPNYQVPFAERIRREAGIATMAVGMITEPMQAEEIVAGGRADMVAIGRQMMFEPHWTWRAALELGAEATYPRQYAVSAPARRPQAFPGRGF